MQIVIDISEEEYAAILGNADIIRKRKKNTLEEAVLSGTPLPKGHGRLIDAGEVSKYVIIGNADLRECPTIIEADKEE